jgi:hypothetical protein
MTTSANMTFVDFVTPIPSVWLSNVNNVVNYTFAPNYTGMQAIPKGSVTQVILLGANTIGDGGGGTYYYVASDTSSAQNLPFIVVATDGGRYYLQNVGNITARQFGAYGNNTTDDSAAIEKVFSYGFYGTRIGAAQYTFATGATQTNTSGSFPIPGQPSARNDVLGESFNNTILNYTGTGYAISLTGSTTGTGQGLNALDRYRNFTLQCGPLNNSNSGLAMIAKSAFKLEDILFNVFSVGLLLTDCYSSSIKNCWFNQCTYGLDFNTATIGPPNAITVENCTFQNCSMMGFLGSSVGTNNVFRDVQFESCGTQGNTGAGAVVCNLTPLSGVVGPIIFDNCYFENSAGGADIIITNTSTTLPATVIIRGCLFQRISSTNYTNNNIQITTAGGPVTVLLEGNTFLSTGTYVPSSGRPFWAGPSNCVFKDLGGNIFSETTSLPAVNGWQHAVPQASGNFTGATGAVNQANNCSIARAGTGSYNVSFTTALPSAVYTPIITGIPGPNGAIGFTVTSQSTTGFSIAATNSANTAVDPTTVWFEVF